jgi:small subunit ribosomal protein S5
MEKAWTPKTRVGVLIREGKIKSIDEIFSEGLSIQEPEVVDLLLPDLQQEVIGINLVQRQTDAGEKSRFKAVVAVGNLNGYVGIGQGRARQVRAAIEKAVQDAKVNITPVRRGCGSWECNCKQLHSLPFKVSGKCGGVYVELLPGPRGLGLVAGDVAKVILKLAGVKDCWTKVRGSTRTTTSLALATFNALMSTYKLNV